jgi:hypothetical protein
MFPSLETFGGEDEPTWWPIPYYLPSRILENSKNAFYGFGLLLQTSHALIHWLDQESVPALVWFGSFCNNLPSKIRRNFTYRLDTQTLHVLGLFNLRKDFFLYILESASTLLWLSFETCQAKWTTLFLSISMYPVEYRIFSFILYSLTFSYPNPHHLKTTHASASKRACTPIHYSWARPPTRLIRKR